MWWLVGIVVAIVAVLVVRFVLRAKQFEAVIRAAIAHILNSYRILRPFEPEFDRSIWSDSYFLGFCESSIVLMTELYAGSLGKTHQGMVGVEALKRLAPTEYAAILDEIWRLHQTSDVEFMRGMEHGSNVTILMANRAGPGLLADPDVQIALTEAPMAHRIGDSVLSKRPMGQTSSAGSVLMGIYLSRHRENLLS